jgi:hypothetical protein
MDFVACPLYIKKYLQAGKSADRRQRCVFSVRSVSLSFDLIKRRRRMRKKKLADTLFEEAQTETCSGIEEKAAILEQGFHIMKKLENDKNSTFRWRNKEYAPTAKKNVYIAASGRGKK